MRARGLMRVSVTGGVPGLDRRQ